MKKLQFSKYRGLIPAIIQDARINKVLMLGFMNKQALQKTRRTKRVTFYSRSKKRLWTKGETSGDYLEVVEIKPDCDGDALLIKVKPQGPTCHTGRESCFADDFENSIIFLESLRALIKERKRTMPRNSYTASLFRAGLFQISTKITEEAEEVARAAKGEGKVRTIEEISDLLYHLLVLMVLRNIEIGEIIKCLKKRHRRSERTTPYS